MAAMVSSPTIHRLKITLQDLKPPIWRRLEVSSTTSLAALHHHIQVAFMWFDCHLHEYDIGGVRYGADDAGGWGEPPVDDAAVTLLDVAPAASSFTYVYDFGDSWVHTIEVEAIEAMVNGVGYPRCTAGRRAAPPEDVGGTWGYAEFVKAVTTPSHPDHAEQVEWLGRDDFDPEHVSLDAINEALRM